jgi:hypothetical protein
MLYHITLNSIFAASILPPKTGKGQGKSKEGE